MAGSNDWEEFDASSECRPILGGAGNQDEFLSAHWPDFIGMSLRLFDPQSKLWSIYWIGNQNMILQPPVVGQFSGSEGISRLFAYDVEVLAKVDTRVTAEALIGPPSVTSDSCAWTRTAP